MTYGTLFESSNLLDMDFYFVTCANTLYQKNRNYNINHLLQILNVDYLPFD